MLSEQKHLICMTMVLGWCPFLDFKFSTLLSVPHSCSANKYSKEAEKKTKVFSVSEKHLVIQSVIQQCTAFTTPGTFLTNSILTAGTKVSIQFRGSFSIPRKSPLEGGKYFTKDQELPGKWSRGSQFCSCYWSANISHTLMFTPNTGVDFGRLPGTLS